MTIIKIDRKTIKKNPDAGKDTKVVPSMLQIYFSITGGMPEWIINPKLDEEGRLIAPKGLIITQLQFDTNGNPAVVEGIVSDTGCAQALKESTGCDLHFQQDLIKIQTLPQPEYFYSYEDPSIPCINCGKETLLSQIPEREGIDDDYQYCPHCDEYDPFKYTYEKFERSMVAE